MIHNKEIDYGKGFDWGKTSEDYARFRDIYPDAFYEKIVNLGLCVRGQKVLDLGTGTGVLPRNMYKYGADFIGTDIAENQIEQAKRLSAKAGMNIEYIVVSAEDIDFPNEKFDVITACQCFMYFNKEVVLPKIHRMLKDDGHFCILFMAWLPDECEIARRSEELVLKYNPTWTGAGMKRYTHDTPVWSKELSLVNELFSAVNMEYFDINVKFTRDTWHGRMKACRGIGASSLSKKEIATWEKEHTEYLQSVPEVFNILHFASVMDFRKK